MQWTKSRIPCSEDRDGTLAAIHINQSLIPAERKL